MFRKGYMAWFHDLVECVPWIQTFVFCWLFQVHDCWKEVKASVDRGHYMTPNKKTVQYFVTNYHTFAARLISPKWVHNFMIPGWIRKLLIQIALCCIPAPCLQRIWYPQRCQKRTSHDQWHDIPNCWHVHPKDILNTTANIARLENPPR